jgi:outer membrane protein OmpA-like peptidoglycan-associated protein
MRSLHSPVHAYDPAADRHDTTEYISGNGRPLDPVDRLYYETRYGVDLSSVRIHEDHATRHAARDIHARAFTSGKHIGIGKSSSDDDRALLDHEMAHVAQQSKPGAGSGLMREDEDLPGIGRTPPSGEFTIERGVGTEDDFVLFNRDSAALDSQDRATIRSLVSQYSQPVTVQLHGYASREGADEYNINLSAHRAMAVKTFIETLLPQGSDVVVFARGETTEFGGQYTNNRRVGIDIIERMQPSQEGTEAAQPTGLSMRSDSPLTLDPMFIIPQSNFSFLFPELDLQLQNPDFFRPIPAPGSSLGYEHGASSVFTSRGVPYTHRDALSFEEHYEFWRDRYILFGLPPERAAWLANLGTDAAAGFQLSIEHPTEQERLDRMFDTEPTSIPLFTDGMMRWLLEQME